jgi:hypothetical protein
MAKTAKGLHLTKSHRLLGKGHESAISLSLWQLPEMDMNLILLILSVIGRDKSKRLFPCIGLFAG